MRALLLIILLLAVVTIVSLYEPALVPYWGERMPTVLSSLSEGRFRDALSAAVAFDPPEAAPGCGSIDEDARLPGTEGDPDSLERRAEAGPDERDERGHVEHEKGDRLRQDDRD